MRAEAVVTSISINDGTVIQLAADGVVLFVGPNNAGKSQALRDISKLVTSQSDVGTVVSSATVEYRGSGADLLARLQEDRSIVKSGAGEDSVGLGERGTQSVSNILTWWGGASSHIVARYFVLLADTETRLLASKPTQALDLYAQNPTHPLHRLYQSSDLEQRIAAISRAAFDSGVILDIWSGGSQWSIRVGDIELPESHRPEQTYLDRLQKLPLLHEEGDGVRSMLGLLLTLLTGHQSISLIDEPEAFLHPPQARYLAKLLAADSASAGRATFLSTHSSDVVHGVLEGDAPATVVRLRRSGTTNHAAVLSNEAVRRLWNDPLLRYSNLLEGLFTDAVVVCESDADCKFFASIRDTIEPDATDSRRPDILFTSCGGKHRMHVGVEALRAASVPVIVVGDFDVLNEWATLARLVKKAGGDPDEFEPDWRILNGALSADARTPSVATVKEAVGTAFDGITEVSTKSLAPVREALKVENGWDRVKKVGLAGVPNGGPRRAAEELLRKLKDHGIFLIPIGEMEDLIPSVGGHGPSWLAEVLERKAHQSQEADTARAFVAGFLEAIQSRAA